MSNLRFIGPARCFDREEDAIEAVGARSAVGRAAIVVCDETPHGDPGMRKVWRGAPIRPGTRARMPTRIPSRAGGAVAIDAGDGIRDQKLTAAELAVLWPARGTIPTSERLWTYADQCGPAADGAAYPGAHTRSSAMQTSSRIILTLMLGATIVAAPVLAFDGAPVNQSAAVGVSQPGQATQAAPSTSVSALEYAAEGGLPIAQWKLGRMYAIGDGVAQDDLRAFEYFNRIANAHAEDNPSSPQAQIVANAFVELGRYYLHGIPNSKVKADPDRAREMLSYAASYFGNAEAQYDLALLYLKTPDASPDNVRYGARWLGLAAQKGQHQAQALLGQMLFNGDRLPRQAARGLMWLTLARDSAGAEETWIKENYNRAFASASAEDRAMALQMLEHWVQGKRD